MTPSIVEVLTIGLIGLLITLVGAVLDNKIIVGIGLGIVLASAYLVIRGYLPWSIQTK